jgi:hypothetical protein
MEWGFSVMDWSPLIQELLGRLSGSPVGWAVLKNHEALPRLDGDIDCAVPRNEWDGFTDEVVRIGHAAGVGVAICEHWPGVRAHFFVPREAPEGFIALEVAAFDSVWWRGRPIVTADDLIAQRFLDQRGFWRLRDGYEAGVLFLCNAMHFDGSRDEEAIAKRRILEKARADPKAFTSFLKRATGPLGARAGDIFLRGSWSRGMVALLELTSVLLALTHPLRFASRSSAKFRRRSGRMCALVTPRGPRREIGARGDEWLDLLARDHAVVGMATREAHEGG